MSTNGQHMKFDTEQEAVNATLRSVAEYMGRVAEADKLRSFTAIADTGNGKLAFCAVGGNLSLKESARHLIEYAAEEYGMGAKVIKINLPLLVITLLVGISIGLAVAP